MRQGTPRLGLESQWETNQGPAPRTLWALTATQSRSPGTETSSRGRSRGTRRKRSGAGCPEHPLPPACRPASTVGGRSQSRTGAPMEGSQPRDMGRRQSGALVTVQPLTHHPFPSSKSRSWQFLLLHSLFPPLPLSPFPPASSTATLSLA